MTRARNSFVIRLVAGVLLMNAFVYLLVGAALYQSHLQYERQTILSTQNLAQTLSISVSGTLKKIDVSLFAVAHEVEGQLRRGELEWPHLADWVRQQHRLSPNWTASASATRAAGCNTPRAPSAKRRLIRPTDRFFPATGGGTA